MTTSFQDRWPTFATLATEVAERIVGKRPDAGMGPGTDGGILRDALAHVANGLHLHLRYGVLHNLIPTMASGIYLDAWAYLFGLADGDRDNPGFGRIKERGCLTADAIQVTATGSTGDLKGEQFSDSSGTVYQINENYTFGGAGSAILDIIGVDVGDKTNIKLADNETLTWVSTPANMSETITQKLDFSGGADKETDAELRDRLREKLQTPPQGGNWSNWKDWVEDTSPGELTAYVWGKRQFSDAGWGYGCVDVVALLALESGSDRIIETTDQMYDDIDAQIIDKAPVLLGRNYRQLTITETEVDIRVNVEFASNATGAQKPDWTDSVATTVASTTVSTRTVETGFSICAPTITDGVEVGDRVIINEAEAVVATVNVGADPKVFTVEDWPAEWGAADDAINGLTVGAGGGVMLTVVDALRTLSDSLGPAKGPYAAPIPGWDDTLRLTAIKSAVVQAADGAIVDVTITTPVADQAPGYDDNSDVELITIDEIYVLEA
jgi:uncharacterized phage protein gp47/JayE